MPMIFRVDAAFDNHPPLGKQKSVMAAATPLWLLIEILSLVGALLDFEPGRNLETAVYASAIVLLRDDHDRD